MKLLQLSFVGEAVEQVPTGEGVPPEGFSPQVETPKGDTPDHSGPRCRKCGRPVRWATLVNGTRMPFDPEPATTWSKGTFKLEGPVASSAASTRFVDPPGCEYFVPHWATCPDAASFRSRPIENPARRLAESRAAIAALEEWEAGGR